MGVTHIERTDLTTYQLSDVAHVWFGQWRDERTLREGLVD